MKLHGLACATVLLLTAGGAAGQATTNTQSTPTAGQRAKQPAVQQASAPRTAVYRGIVVGDRRTTRFYHPSDPRKPGEKRRVYFPSPEAARAARYRPAQPWRLP